MRPRIPTTWLWASAAALLAALLAVLAVLQFRWIDAVAVAERERMQAHLRAASERLTQEFDHEVMRACMTFLVAPFEWREGHWRDIDEHMRVWRQTAAFPGLIRNIHVIQVQPSGAAELYRYEAREHALRPVPWEERLQPVRARLEARRGQGGPPAQWTIDGRIPALVLSVSDAGAWQGEAGGNHETGALILELDEDQLRTAILPALVRKHLAVSAGLDYQVEVRAAAGGRVVYASSDAQAMGQAKPDLEMAFFTLRPQDAGRFAPATAFETAGPGRRGQGQGQGKGRGPRTDRPAFRGRGLVAQSVQGAGEGHWRLLVRHRAGSLEAAVEGLRRRNLALGFATLLLLGASVFLIFTLMRRTQRLARAHAEFLAGISHELLTPLAVIRSAADNLADGVAMPGERAQQYGEIIRKQSRRLSEMVQDALGFAVAQSVASERFREVNLEDVVRRAVETCRPAIAGAGVEFVQELEPELPKVHGDATALSHMLRNLLMNGLQYGGAGGYLAVKAKRAGIGRHVEITVEDKGQGIDPAELQRIFEPFFRGQGAARQRLHGTGLGLSLVKRIAEDHRGSVSVESRRPGGTLFTVRLPASARPPAAGGE